MSDDYAENWASYRKRRNWMLFLFLGWLPIAGGLSIGLSMLFHSDIPFFMIAVPWFVAFGIASILHNLFACPRCRKRFFIKTLYHNHFARKCVHCGLPKYAERQIGNETEQPSCNVR